MLPFLAIFAFLDSIQGVCSGILRGTGQQKLGAVANLVAFYAIGLPMAWVVCFRLDFGVNGLLIGLSFGTLFQTCLLLYYIYYRESYIFSSKVLTSVETTDNSINPLQTTEIVFNKKINSFIVENL